MPIDIPKEARQKYIERRRADLEKCNQALQQRDFELIGRVAHQIKGNASTFGYDDLGRIAIQLEEHAHAKDAENVAKALSQFSQFLSQP